MAAKRTILALTVATALALLGVTGCGTGSSSGGGGGAMDDITWPSRDGGTTTQLPPVIKTGRVHFASASGESCCVAVDPALLSGSAQRGLAILNDLPAGPATVTVAGFTTDFAPAIAGVVLTCSTSPADAARPCDPVRVAAPAFESPPLSVNIIAGAQTNIGEVPMEALPFLFDFSPAQGASAPAPVQFALTVVDAVTNIARESVALEVSFEVPDEQGGSGSPFRRLTKRVTLSLNPCADGTNQPCSPQGNLELEGFAATGTAPELPEGEVEARVMAENLADPRRKLDFRYPFVVLATPTATATAVPTAEDAGNAEGAQAGGSSGTSTEQPAGAPDAPPGPAAASAGHSQSNPPTPTATPQPGGSS